MKKIILIHTSLQQHLSSKVLNKFLTDVSWTSSSCYASKWKPIMYVAKKPSSYGPVQ